MQEGEKQGLEAPFTMEELEAALKSCATNRSPGLDGLPYEFYKCVKDIIGPTLLEVFQEGLDNGVLVPSMRKGVTRLLNKVQGIPSVTDLRPITLLSTDYKIMTKLLVSRLTRVLPSVLTSGQLCSNSPRNILFGASNLLSTIDYINLNNLSAYLISFDIFKAFDKTSVNFITQVMERMNFGQKFISYIKACHTDITTQFILGNLSRQLKVLISLRQGDPIAMALFLINIEPLLVYLRDKISGLTVGGASQKDEDFVDDISAASIDLEDMVKLNHAFMHFEGVSGTVLNRTSKTKVMGLGGWTNRNVWPLSWVRTVPSLRIFGLQFYPTVQDTIKASWDTCKTGINNCLQSWSSRTLPTLSQRVQIINTFALSKLWYLAQVLPIPQGVTNDLEKLIRSFLWLGRMEKLPYEELVSPTNAGGLGLVNISSKCDALLITQICRVLSHRGPYREHLKYWFGVSLRAYLPDLLAGPNAEILTPYFRKVVNLLKEVFSSDLVDPQRLELVKAKYLYLELISTPPPPKVMYNNPGFNWSVIWKRLEDPMISPQGKDILFSILHNIYRNKQRLFRMNQHPTGNCDVCRGQEESNLHLFTGCQRSQGTWFYTKTIIMFLLPPNVLLLDDQKLLFLDFPGGHRTSEILFVMSFYVLYIHICRYNGEYPSIGNFQGFLKDKIYSYMHGRFPRLNLLQLL